LLDYDKDPRAIFQVALVQEASEEDTPSNHSSDNELEGLLRRTSATTEDMDEADEIELVSSSSEDESYHQSDEETEEEPPEEQQGVFVTVQADADTTKFKQQEVFVTVQADADTTTTKFMPKGAYRQVRAVLKTIQEGMVVEEKGKENKKAKGKENKKVKANGKENKKVKKTTNVEKTLVGASAEPPSAEPRRARAGPWRVLEIFMWTCMVTMAAHYKGWEAFEPITLSGWDLNVAEVRAKAREYSVQIDPNFVGIAPPCGPWSQVQRINQKTPLQVRELQTRRELLFLVVHFQLQHGRAVGGKPHEIAAVGTDAYVDHRGIARCGGRDRGHVRLP
jgi:hypothetical protein